MQIYLSDHFSYSKLLRFSLPSVIMMVFTTIYGIVNGFAISNVVGKIAFAAINLIIPLSATLAVFGFMFGSGGAALISKVLGEGKREEANSLFSTILYIMVLSGLLLSAIGQVLLPYATKLLGADGELLEQGLVYGRISLIFLPAIMLQYVNQYIFPTAEKSKMGMYFTVAAGIANIVFVLLFVVVFDMGVLGAGLANGIGQCIGGLLPLCYFFGKRNDSLLRPAKPVFKRSDFTKMCSNGASEFVTNLSLCIIGNLFNFQLLRMIGVNGVAAFGVIMYINILFISVFTGYSIAVSPIVGFNNGAGNYQELRNVFQ